MVDKNGQKLAFGEATKRLAALWKDSDDETKQKFQKLAEEEKKILLSST